MLSKINFTKVILSAVVVGVLVAILKFALSKIIDVPDSVYSGIIIAYVLVVVMFANKWFAKKQ